MSDNRIVSKDKYIVRSVSGINIENNVSKRPYANIPESYGKKQNSSKSFKKSLNSEKFKNSSNDDSITFTNELENMVRLKSEENLRMVQAEFKDKPLNIPNKIIVQNELHNKLSQAMDVEVDISTLYKKFQLISSL